MTPSSNNWIEETDESGLTAAVIFLDVLIELSVMSLKLFVGGFYDGFETQFFTFRCFT